MTTISPVKSSNQGYTTLFQRKNDGNRNASFSTSTEKSAAVADTNTNSSYSQGSASAETAGSIAAVSSGSSFSAVA